ncbi:MAG: hypothetical protein NZ585_12575 [Chloracidobacterium sp.]|nr:hypothetical protein [Chloracidobacterium sp.]MDW8216261.1 hypothetical protein [Acidobacteriota bacterium]
MSPYGRPPAYGPPPPTSPSAGKPVLPFVLQTLLGFFGTLAYAVVLFVLIAIAFELSQVVFGLVCFGGLGFGLAAVLFLTFYFRWYGLLVGVALAFLVPALLVGACTAFVIGVSILNLAGF